MWLHYCRGPTRRSLGNVSRSSPGGIATAHVNSNGSAGSSQQWSPEFPVARENEKPHSKFVPMQFRTQPANLPTGMRRQSTNLHAADVKGS